MSEVEPEWLGDVRTTKLTRLGQNGSAIISRFSAHAHLEGPSPASKSSRCGKVSLGNKGFGLWATRGLGNKGLPRAFWTL